MYTIRAGTAGRGGGGVGKSLVERGGRPEREYELGGL